MEIQLCMHLNKHFLFIIGAPALLVLLVVGAGLYRAESIETESDMRVQTTIEHVVREEGAASQEAAQPTPPPGEQQQAVPTQVSSSEDQGTHFTGTLQEVNTGCFADGECFVVVSGKHVTAVRGWSQETVGTIQGVEGFGDLTKHIGEQMEVYAYGVGDGVYTLYGNTALYITLSSTTVHVSNAHERPEVQ